MGKHMARTAATAKSFAIRIMSSPFDCAFEMKAASVWGRGEGETTAGAIAILLF